jgi:hypothetical protein
VLLRRVEEPPCVLPGLLAADPILVVRRVELAVFLDEVEQFLRVAIEVVERLVAEVFPELLNDQLPRHRVERCGSEDHEADRMTF